MKKNLFALGALFLSFLLVPVTMTSCGDDEDDSNSEQQTPGNNNGQGTNTNISSNIPLGWYDSGDLKKYATQTLEDMASAGDWIGIERMDWENGFDFATAYHVISQTQIANAYGGASLKQPSSYYDKATVSKGGKTYTLYFFYSGYFDEPYEYTVSGNTITLQTKYGPYKLTYSNNKLIDDNRTYTKNNYTGKPKYY